MKKPGAKVGKWKSYSPEFRLKAVLLHVEGGHSRAEVSRQLGVPYQSIKDWVTRFHRQGQGAAAAAHPRGVEKIVELKKENRRRGVRAGAFHDLEVDQGGLMAAAAATLRAVAALQSI